MVFKALRKLCFFCYYFCDMSCFFVEKVRKISCANFNSQTSCNIRGFLCVGEYTIKYYSFLGYDTVQFGRWKRHVLRCRLPKARNFYCNPSLHIISFLTTKYSMIKFYDNSMFSFIILTSSCVKANK